MDPRATIHFIPARLRSSLSGSEAQAYFEKEGNNSESKRQKGEAENEQSTCERETIKQNKIKAVNRKTENKRDIRTRKADTSLAIWVSVATVPSWNSRAPSLRALAIAIAPPGK